ncbi:MAG: hypothetical protein GEU28_01165 [Dehalococcoidia bacterium]|nr:hypothetical protein [Dehalococcoidia bacterium]
MLRLVLAALVGAAALVGCSSTDDDDDEGEAESGVVYTDDAIADGVSGILATPDLAVGRQRFGIVLLDRIGLVRLPVVNYSTFFHPEDGSAEGPLQTGQARFMPFPEGERGFYITELDLDRAGRWSIAADIPRPDGTVETFELGFDVAEEAAALAVGDTAPPSDSSTAADVSSLAELTTGSEPDPALYGTGIDDALAASRPFVVVFASPAFCTNEVCGPQVEVLSELAAAHPDAAAYVHVDIYENPDEIDGDLDRAIRNPILEEWGVTSDEWTFVVDADGRVAARFESFATYDEVEAALLAVIS